MTDLMEIIKLVQDYERDIADLHDQVLHMTKQMAKVNELACKALENTTLSYNEKSLNFFDSDDSIENLIKFINKYEYNERITELKRKKEQRKNDETNTGN